MSESDISQEQKRFYQAIGVVQGALSEEDNVWTLTVEGRSYPAKVQPKKVPLVTIGQTQYFRVYPKWYKEALGFKIMSVLKTARPEEFTLSGDWINQQDGPRIAIHRNPQSRTWIKPTCSLLPVEWPEAPIPDGQFWSLTAILKEGALVITSAVGPFESPERLTEEYHQALKGQPKPKPKPKKAQTPKATIPSEPVRTLSSQEILAMAMPTKIQITCKINAVPQHQEVSPGEVEFYLVDGERVLTVRMKAKQFKKLTTHSYEDWVAAVSGNLGAVTETGFMLDSPSIQVFEKKPAPPKDKKSPEAETKKQSVAPQAEEPKKPKKHNLMAGIKVG